VRTGSRSPLLQYYSTPTSPQRDLPSPRVSGPRGPSSFTITSAPDLESCHPKPPPSTAPSAAAQPQPAPTEATPTLSSPPPPRPHATSNHPRILDTSSATPIVAPCHRHLAVLLVGIPLPYYHSVPSVSPPLPPYWTTEERSTPPSPLPSLLETMATARC
jgi:hypothetical protein